MIQQKRIFVTKMTYAGDLRSAGSGASGLDGADKLCTLAAKAANKSGTFIAWLSDSKTNAIDRIKDVGPWYLVGTEEVVFNNKANMMTEPQRPINRDEMGDEVEAPWDAVWTGTVAGGKSNCDARLLGCCEDWASIEGKGYKGGGRLGDASTTTGWSDKQEDGSCIARYRLYCIEQ